MFREDQGVDLDFCDFVDAGQLVCNVNSRLFLDRLFQVP